MYLTEKLLYDNSSPRPLEEFISENSDAAIKSFSSSLIPIEDSDSLMEEIDLSLTLDDSMPPGIKNDDYDSKGDILILKELLRNDSLSLPKNESFHFDIPSSPRPPAKPPDDDEIKPNLGILTVKVLGDIFEHYVPMPRLCPPNPPLLQIRRNLLISYLIKLSYGGNRVKLSDLKQALRGRQPMLILVVVLMNKCVVLKRLASSISRVLWFCMSKNSRILKTLARGFVIPSLIFTSSASFGNQISKSYRLTFILWHT
nr:hypothetical protein [Tanacetum cinerariifolium]